MGRYVFVSKKAILDCDEKRLISPSDCHADEVDIPSFLWDYRVINPSEEWRSVFGKRVRSKDYGFTCYERGFCRFTDFTITCEAGVRHVRSTLGVHLDPNDRIKILLESSNAIPYIDCYGRVFGERGKGSIRDFNMELPSRRRATQFITSDIGILYREIEKHNGEFPFGLSTRQYHVYYQGQELKGTSYAMLYGDVAILLGDDFTFDSVALLLRIDTGVLHVGKFVYSVNPYIVKCMTMMPKRG